MADPAVRLVVARDADFGALLGGGAPERDGVAFGIPPGGVEDAAVLMTVRRLAARVAAEWCASHWLVVAGDEIVGLIGCKGAPTAAGEIEIGYGMARTRRNRGFGSAAVAGVVAEVRGRPGVRAILAETVVGNLASQKVLERNGFVGSGRRFDAEDGEVLAWRLPLADASDHP